MITVAVAAAGTIFVNDCTTTGAVDNTTASTNNCVYAQSSAVVGTFLANAVCDQGMVITVPASVVAAISFN
jgi:hypothetical protein